MRFLRSLGLSLVILAVPAIALAAFAKPSELLKALQFRGRPVDVFYEAHAHVDDVDVSAWLKGEAEGTDAATAKANIHVTVDMVQKTRGNLRVKGEIRIVNKTAYMQVQNIEGTFRDESVDTVARLAGKQWYSVPLNESAQAQEALGGMSAKEAEDLLWKLTDSALSLNRAKAGEGSVYSLQLKRTAWKEIVPVIQEISQQQGSAIGKPTNRELAQLRKILAKIKLHLKITTNVADEPTAIKFYAAVTDRAFDGVLQGTASLRSSPVTVTVPPNAQPFESAMQSWTDSQLGEARDAQRRSDVNTLLNGVYQYAIDNDGKLPAALPSVPTEICNSDAQDCTGMVDLRPLWGTYLVYSPLDPRIQEEQRGMNELRKTRGTGYRIWQDSSGRITVEAMYPEKTTVIKVMR